MYGAQRIDPDDFDRDAEVQSEAEVVNISNDVQRFEIATQAGSKPRRYRLEPFGKQGDSIHVQAGYTAPYKGAGIGMVRPTIEAMSEVEIIAEIAPTSTNPGRPALRLPVIVARSGARRARAQYLDALAKAKDMSSDSMPTLVLQTEHGTPVRAKVQRAPAPPVEDVEDFSTTPLDEPPPEDDMPPVAIGPDVTAPAATEGKGSKGKNR